MLLLKLDAVIRRTEISFILNKKYMSVISNRYGSFMAIFWLMISWQVHLYRYYPSSYHLPILIHRKLPSIQHSSWYHMLKNFSYADLDPINLSSSKWIILREKIMHMFREMSVNSIICLLSVVNCIVYFTASIL